MSKNIFIFKRSYNNLEMDLEVEIKWFEAKELD